VLAVMATWTAVMSVANGSRRCRRWAWCVADLCVATVTLLCTAYVDGEGGLLARSITLTGPWPAAAVLSCAVLGGPWRGMLASTVVVGATVVLPGTWRDVDTLDNVVLLVLAAGAVGLVARLLERAEHRIRHLAEREAAAAERDRMARSIHDGVLQVLALVQRDGPGLGARGAELANLARAQESALRNLVVRARSGPQDPKRDTTQDLRALLAELADDTPAHDGRPAAELAVPATPLLLPAAAAHELAAAVGAALDNVARHAGPHARAWILVEDEPGELTVTVRDNGPGIPEGRLDEAESAGRLGVAQSMRGRVADLGGSTTITSWAGKGTEVEFRIPRS